jgi:two-component system NarL family response regulator
LNLGANQTEQARNPIRIAIVDDHPAILIGLRSMLSMQPGLQVVATLSSGAQLNALLPDESPDLFLVDIRMPDVSGIECIQIIRCRYPEARILMITSYDLNEDVFRALEAGAAGYITKNAGKDEMLLAIQRIRAGKRYLSPAVAQKLRERGPRAAITTRELEILRFVAKGKTNRQIGEQLSISQITVRNHVNSLIAKLQAQDRTDAAVSALKLGLLHLEDI